MQSRNGSKYPDVKNRLAGVSLDFWAILLLLIVIFLMGGASRADVKSLVFLRPIAAAACVLGVALLRANDLGRYKGTLIFAAACVLLVALQLVPLPPVLWQALPGRSIFAEVDSTIGVDVWRPIALNPSGAWNSFFALAVPAAVLLLGIRLSREELFKLLPVVVASGLISGIVGLGQSIGSPEGPLYFYRVTNNGAAVGLFANRNHQAFLLAILFPMLAVCAAILDRRQKSYAVKLWGCALAAAALVPLLLVTGSRTGIVLGLFGILAGAALARSGSIKFHFSASKRRFNPAHIFAIFVGIALVAVTIATSRAEAVRRLLGIDEAEELRFAIWGPITKMAWKYFPVGSGVGSFAEVYQIDEPSQLLRYSYVNHAHNDWLEILLTTGLPGVLLMSVSVIAVAKQGLELRKSQPGSRSRHFGQLGLLVLVMLSMGSVTDYPLRTPLMSAMAVIAYLWLHSGSSSPNKQTSGSAVG